MSHIIRRALKEKRDCLLEHEVLTLFAELKLPVPHHTFVPLSQLATCERALRDFPKGRSVLKIVSDKILHKSDAGGVAFLDTPTPKIVTATAKKILDQLPPDLRHSVRGVLLEEAVACESGPGHELYLGMRQTREFGLVSTVGFGGTYMEALETATRADQATLVFRPDITTKKQFRQRLEDTLFYRWTTGKIRGVNATASPQALRRTIEKWLAAMDHIRLAIEAEGAEVQEMEINPLVFAGKWIPVDALVLMKLASDNTLPVGPFPIANFKKGLHPKRTALIGVSKRMNIGRSILRSLLDGGYPTDRISIIRDGTTSIDGVSCIPSMAHLQKDVDLLIVAVRAAQVPKILAEAFKSKKIRAVLLIPDGIAKGTKVERRVQTLIREHTGSNRPAVIGNNSLGFISKPARFDSLFIPREKLPRSEGPANRNVALISQSGAFMLATLHKLSFLSPEYQISIGNQLDARMSHYLEVLSAKKNISTFALYIEGLKKGDGLKIAKLVKKIVGTSSGHNSPRRDVIVYKAGRSHLGRNAAMGHTASVAGNWRVFRSLMRDAGAIVAETFSDFVGLVRLSSSIGDRSFSGRRIAMMTNAGFEAVGMADNHQADSHTLIPAAFSKSTIGRVTDALKASHLDALVQVSNPLDLTPMANDALHVTCMGAILKDSGVDAAVFGCVPFTSAIQTFPSKRPDTRFFDTRAGYPNLTIKLFNNSTKPFVIVINAGHDYDAMVTRLEHAGVPVFRNADDATRLLGIYVESKIGPVSGD